MAASQSQAQTRPAQRQQAPAPARGPVFLQHAKSFEETQYVSKVVLKNGMTVLVNEYHAFPVVSVLARIRAGNMTDPSDSPGMARLLEEMLFKGTSTRAIGVVRQDVQALGGTLNRLVAYDSTSIEAVVPSMQWKKALEIQADLLLNPSFDSEELKREADLALMEMRAEQDDAQVFAFEKLLELGFPGHRLRRWTATPESLHAISREKLLDYFKSYYGPSRTILVIAGDVASSEVLNEAATLFDKPKPPGEKPLPVQEEAGQSSFRYSEIHGAVQVPRILFGFHAPPITADDHPAVEVLRAILGIGESSVVAARLRDEKKVILGGSAGLLAPADIGYLTISMEADPKDIDKCEIAALTELELIKKEEPSAADMERALAQLERMYWERLQSVSGRAHLYGMYEALGDWKKLTRYVERIRQVKPADVSRVAGKYLKLENCSLLEFLPVDAEARHLTADSALATFRGLIAASVEQESAERERQTQLALDIPSEPGTFKFSEVRSQFQTASILRGPDLFIKEAHTAPLIHMGFFFPGGRLIETSENSGVTELMLRTMLRGTEDRGPERYLRQLEIYGGRIRPVVTDDYSGFFLTVLSRNVDSALALLGGAVKTPKLDKDEFAWQKQLQSSAVRIRVEDESEYPQMLLDQVLFKGHPYAMPPGGSEKILAELKLQDVQKWYQSEVRNKKPIIVILGDTQGTTLAGYFVKNFSGSRFQDVKLPEAFAKPLDKRQVIEQGWDKNESVVALAFQAPPDGDEDAFPVEVLQSYFSGSGGKLPVEICDKQGLAYSVAMDYKPRNRGGSLNVFVRTNPANEEKALKSLEDVFGKFFDNPITYRDFRSAVNSAVGTYWIERQEPYSQIASAVANLLAGKGIDELPAYATHIQEVKQDDLLEVAPRVIKMDKSVTLRLHGRP